MLLKMLMDGGSHLQVGPEAPTPGSAALSKRLIGCKADRLFIKLTNL